MMLPDVIVSWPRNNDYPLWRQFIRDNRNRFAKVIIVFTETNQGANYKKFVMDAMNEDNVTFFDSPTYGAEQDWRDVAVNCALQYSTSNWVWFTEQDFYPRNGFWNYVDSLYTLGYDVIATYDAGRMHPCNILLKRSVLDKTRKNFAIVPGVADHFGQLQIDLEQMDIKIGAIHPDAYFHYNGLSHNFTLMSRGETPNYYPEEFNQYLNMCLEVNVPLEPGFVSLVRGFLSYQ